MSGQDLNKKQTTPKLERLQLEGQIPLIISDEILDKIKFLCKRINKVEWSGLMFYKVEGSFQKPKECKLVVKDILLMDKGTHTYTEYDWDEDVVNYQMDHPETMEENWIIGHIHSHNTMDVFFSGTDWSELNDNCPKHNIYLSLIVNNYMEMTAMVAFTAEPKKFNCKDEHGKDYVLKVNTDFQPWMFVYTCDIQANFPEALKFDELDQRIELITKKKEEEAKKKAAIKPATVYNQPSNQTVNQIANKTVVEGFNFNKNKTKELANSGKWGKSQYQQGQLSPTWDDLDEGIVRSDENAYYKLSTEERFVACILRLGSEEEDYDSLYDVLMDVEAAGLNAESLSTTIMENYGAYFTKFFDKELGYDGDGAFLKTLERVIDILEEHETEYSYLTPIIMRLKSLGNKFEQLKLQSNESTAQ
jgi:proteasome lid subunit RPN8/RPN11